jgi:hypothetical protein
MIDICSKSAKEAKAKMPNPGHGVVLYYLVNGGERWVLGNQPDLAVLTAEQRARYDNEPGMWILDVRCIAERRNSDRRAMGG